MSYKKSPAIKLQDFFYNSFYFFIIQNKKITLSNDS